MPVVLLFDGAAIPRLESQRLCACLLEAGCQVNLCSASEEVFAVLETAMPQAVVLNMDPGEEEAFWVLEEIRWKSKFKALPVFCLGPEPHWFSADAIALMEGWSLGLFGDHDLTPLLGQIRNLPFVAEVWQDFPLPEEAAPAAEVISASA